MNEALDPSLYDILFEVLTNTSQVSHPSLSCIQLSPSFLNGGLSPLPDNANTNNQCIFDVNPGLKDKTHLFDEKESTEIVLNGHGNNSSGDSSVSRNYSFHCLISYDCRI